MEQETSLDLWCLVFGACFQEIFPLSRRPGFNDGWDMGNWGGSNGKPKLDDVVSKHCLIAAAALVAALAVLHPAAAAEPEKKKKESAQAPSAEATNALAVFQVKRGFRIELVASATLV